MTDKLDECMVLPVYDPNDTDETFKAKLDKLKEEQAKWSRASVCATSMQLQFNLPKEVWLAYAQLDRLDEIEVVKQVFEMLFARVLEDRIKEPTDDTKASS